MPEGRKVVTGRSLVPVVGWARLLLSSLCAAVCFACTDRGAPAPPKEGEVPEVVTRFWRAARGYDFAEMFRLIDWPLFGAGEWARAVDSPYLTDRDVTPERVAEGFKELEHITRKEVQSQLGEMALHLAADGEARPATERQRAAVLAVVAVPKVVRSLPPHIVKRLSEERARAAQVTAVWVLVVEGRKKFFAVTPDWARVIPVTVSDPG